MTAFRIKSVEKPRTPPPSVNSQLVIHNSPLNLLPSDRTRSGTPASVFLSASARENTSAGIRGFCCSGTPVMLLTASKAVWIVLALVTSFAYSLDAVSRSTCALISSLQHQYCSTPYQYSSISGKLGVPGGLTIPNP